MREEGGNRNWYRWYNLKSQLDSAYKEEEMYWSQKAMSQWLKEGDNNTQYFHASVMSRIKCYRIDHLKKKMGGVCRTEEVIGEISNFYAGLFTSEDSLG